MPDAAADLHPFHRSPSNRRSPLLPAAAGQRLLPLPARSSPNARPRAQASRSSREGSRPRSRVLRAGALGSHRRPRRAGACAGSSSCERSRWHCVAGFRAGGLLREDSLTPLVHVNLATAPHSAGRSLRHGAARHGGGRRRRLPPPDLLRIPPPLPRRRVPAAAAALPARRRHRSVAARPPLAPPRQVRHRPFARSVVLICNAPIPVILEADEGEDGRSPHASTALLDGAGAGRNGGGHQSHPRRSPRPRRGHGAPA